MATSWSISRGRDKLLVPARQVFHKLFQDELITAVTIVGTNDGRDGCHGTIQYWDETKSQFCVAVLDTKKTPSSNTKHIQKRFFYPNNLVARKDSPREKRTTKKNGPSMNRQEHRQHHINVDEISVEYLVDKYDLAPFPVEKTTIQKWLSTMSSTTDVAVEMDLFLDVVMNERDSEELERARWEQELKAEEEAAKKRRAEKKRAEQEEYEERRRQYEEEKRQYEEYRKEHRQASYRESQGDNRGSHRDVYERIFASFFSGHGGDGFAFEFNDFNDEYFDSRWEEEMEKQRLAELEKHADVLGVSVDSPRDVIARQFRRVAMKWHPERHVGKDTQADAKEKFQEMQNAYDALLSALDEEEEN